MRSLLLASFVTALFSFGCGGAKAGESCDQTGFLCADNTAALECRLGKWTTLPCRGIAGCSESDGTIRCDMSANQENDACASTSEGKGLCTVDGRATLECRQGVLVRTNTCTSCAVSGDQVVCTQ